MTGLTCRPGAYGLAELAAAVEAAQVERRGSEPEPYRSTV